MLGLTPAVWMTEARVPSPVAVSKSCVTEPSVGDVAVDDRVRDAEAGQRGDRAFEPVRPDVADDDRVVSTDNLRGGQTHTTGTARDYRHAIHRWTVHGQGC